MKNIHIFFIYKNLNIGGIEKEIIQIINHIDRKKFTPCLILFNKTGKLLENLDKSVEVIDLNQQNHIAIPLTLAKLIKEIKRKNPEILFSLGNYSNIITICTKPFIKRSRIIICEGDKLSRWFQFVKLGRIRRIVAKLIYPQTDKIIVYSQEIKRDLILNFNIAKEKIIIINCSVDKSSLEKILKTKKKAIRQLKKQNYITYVGRLAKKKNIQYLIRSFHQVVKKYPSLKLYIIGDGPEKVKLKNQVKSLNLNNSVKIFEGVTDPTKYIAGAQMLILPSLSEGFPKIILESMVCKTPVVVANYQGSSEIITNRSTGLIANLKNIKNLSKNINCLIEDKPLRKHIINNAYRLSSQYDIEASIKIYEKLFETI